MGGVRGRREQGWVEKCKEGKGSGLNHAIPYHTVSYCAIGCHTILFRDIFIWEIGTPPFLRMV